MNLWISILHHHPISTTFMWQRLSRRFYTQSYHIHDDQRTIIDIHKSYIPYSPIPTINHHFLIMLYNILNCSMIMEKMIESPFFPCNLYFPTRFTCICDMLLYCIYSVVQAIKKIILAVGSITLSQDLLLPNEKPWRSFSLHIAYGLSDFFPPGYSSGS